MALPVEAKPLISDEERARRQRVIRHTVRSNAIEGQRHTDDVEPIFEAYIAGEIEVTEMMPRFKTLRAKDNR